MSQNLILLEEVFAKLFQILHSLFLPFDAPLSLVVPHILVLGLLPERELLFMDSRSLGCEVSHNFLTLAKDFSLAFDVEQCSLLQCFRS